MSALAWPPPSLRCVQAGLTAAPDSAVLAAELQALTICRQAVGEEHTDTAECHLAVGATLHALGRLDDAWAAKQAGVDTCRAVHGEQHERTAAASESAGVTLYELGRLSEALKAMQRALQINRVVLGEEHKQTASAYDALGVTLHVLGHWARLRRPSVGRWTSAKHCTGRSTRRQPSPANHWV